MMKCIGIAIGIVIFLVILFIQSAVVAALLAGEDNRARNGSSEKESITNKDRRK